MGWGYKYCRVELALTLMDVTSLFLLRLRNDVCASARACVCLWGVCVCVCVCVCVIEGECVCYRRRENINEDTKAGGQSRDT